MRPTVYYCYDAWCGWCFGFSGVIHKISQDYQADFFFDVLSGGMIPVENKRPVKATASYIKNSYPHIEELAGVKFGEYYLWHIEHPDESDWFPESLTPAKAMCILKEHHPEKAVEFAIALQLALFKEGRDLTDPEAYRHLLSEFNLPADSFFEKLDENRYSDMAKYEFAMVKQLQVSGFPSVLMQISDAKFYLLSRGYTSYEDIKQRIENILTEINYTKHDLNDNTQSNH
jgi:putative protein-disulfide isomerase